MYSSRSAVEAYQDCPRYRYNQYFLNGKGVVGVRKSVPLVTGSAVHCGVEFLLNQLRIDTLNDGSVDAAVLISKQEYVKDVGTAGFTGNGLKTDKQQWFTFNEQMALTEGLIRAWAIAELPQIQKRYKVLAVEREIEPIEIAEGVEFQARVDAEFQEISSGDYHNYSLKTASQWGERSENSYKSDLQSATEIWMVEQDQKRGNKTIDAVVADCELLNKLGRFPQKGVQDIAAYLGKRKIDKQVSAIRFCFLIKGARKKPDYYGNDPEALMITYSPLIRGYKRFTPSSVEYAHSWFYPNPDNKSGKSALGKGWEPFNVWEDPMGVKGWIEKIASGEVQSECGDIIKQQVVTPPEYFRSDDEIEEAIMEVKLQERHIREANTYIEYLIKTQHDTSVAMAETFPHNRKHCYFHFGGECEYLSLCWKPEVTQDPIGSGLYQIREAHHQAERESL